MRKFQFLLACYRSGQMSAAQMLGHMRDDPDFAEFVKAEFG